MKKKIKTAVLLVLVLVMSASILYGCAPKAATETSPSASASASASAAATESATPTAESWSPFDGAPTSYVADSEVYTMANRTPWNGIYAPQESSRADIVKALKADNRKDSVTVGYATWTTGTPFFAGMMETIQKECDKYGWKLITAVSDADVNKQIANVQNFIVMGVDIIIDNAISVEAEATVIKECVDAGIPVIGLGLPFPKGTPLITNCATMYYEQGFMVGAYVADYYKGKDVVAATEPGMIGHPIAESKLNGFIGGFVYERAIQLGKPFATREDAMLYAYKLEQQIVTGSKFSDPDLKWEVVASIDGSWSQDGGMKATEDLLTAHKDINFIFTDNDEEGQGAIRAIQNAGLKPGTDIQVASVGDGSKGGLELVKDGSYLCMTLASPYTWSKACTDLAYKIFHDGFDATNLPSDSNLENVFVTKENVDKYMPTKDYSTLPDQVFTPLG